MFCSVRTLSEKKSASRWKFPGEVVKTALPVSVKIFSGEPLFWDEILFFQSLFDIEQKKCHLLANVFRLSWKKCFFECLLEFLGKFLKLKFWFSNQCRSWARFFRILTKTLLHDGQNFFFWNHRHIMRKKIFSKFLFFSIFFGHRSKVSAFWWKFFGRVVESAVLVSIGNLWLTVFHLKRFRVFFWVEEIQPFVLSFSTGSSKMLATCP